MSGAAQRAVAEGHTAIADVTRRLAALRVIPLATLDGRSAPAVGAALVRGGLPCIEIAFRNDSAAEAIAAARQIEGLLVGAGTVLTEQQLEAAVAAGAHFAVAPGTNDRVIARAGELGIPFFPGVATPTEIDHARELGLSVMKAFPVVALGGPGFLRAVHATYPDVRFIPTGGITADSLADYLPEPNVLACAGSWLVAPSLVREKAFDLIEVRARQAAETGQTIGADR